MLKKNYFYTFTIFISLLTCLNSMYSMCNNQPINAQFNSSINLIWLNKNINQDSPYIYPSPNKTEFYKNFLQNILEWAKLNPKSVINIWFDQNSISSNAKLNTLKEIQDYTNQDKKIASVNLRDIRTLSIIKKNPEIFSSEIPIYFRVDILRAIIAIHILNNNESNYFIYADLDTTPISHDEIFNLETRNHLEKYSIVMAYADNIEGFENGFQIISNDKINLLKAMQYIIIDLNLHRIKTLLKCQYKPLKDIELIVYGSYKRMFQYFYHLENQGILYLSGANNLITKYDKNIYKFEPFNQDYPIFLSPNSTNDALIFINSNNTTEIFIPTKKINIPPSNFDEGLSSLFFE
ncbi:hypothetical protein GF322_02985 [Candidatus Dependentiae bacterium]|nr:hypothetical protein [Candidatus Dependentiae bacterium]